MRMMNFCKFPFAVLLFLFATFKLFFRHSFYHFFVCVRTRLKTVYMLIYVTQKLKWKFDIRDSWLDTFLVHEPCQRNPPPATCAILCVLIGYPSGHWGPTCLLGISRVCPARKTSLCDHIINPLLTKFVRPRWLGIALVLFCVLTSEICAILDRCTFCRSTKRSMKKVLSQRFLLSSFKTLYNAKYLQNAGKLETWELENNVGTTHFSYVQTNLVPRVEEDPGNEVVFTRTNFRPAEKVTGFSFYTGPFKISTL